MLAIAVYRGNIVLREFAPLIIHLGVTGRLAAACLTASLISFADPTTRSFPMNSSSKPPDREKLAMVEVLTLLWSQAQVTNYRVAICSKLLIPQLLPRKFL